MNYREQFRDVIKSWWREGEYLRFALELFDEAFGYPDERCPIIEMWRHQFIDKQNWYLPGYSAPVNYSRRSIPDSVGVPDMYLPEMPVSLPRRRRQNLQEIESKRDGIIRDRYYFGIYNKDF